MELHPGAPHHDDGRRVRAAEVVTAPVSILIPTFRRCAMLAETLNSLRRCEPLPSEILVMVDYGDRETRTSLEPLFPDVRWIEAKERLGPGGARNVLVARASHPYLVSFDDDSYPVDKDFFAVVVDLFGKYPEAGIIGGGAIVHDGEFLPLRTGEIRYATEFVGCGVAIRRAAFLETRGYLPLELAYGAEEVDVSLQLLDKGWKILSSGALRVRHRTSRAHQATPEVTSAHIRNIALVGYLRYPRLLWSLAAAQVGRRVIWSLRNGRSAGVAHGLVSIPRSLWRHRSQRAPVKARVILDTHGLRRGVL